MREASQPIGVIGAGSVGTILAAHFEASGRRTVVVECGSRHDQVKTDGLRVTGSLLVSAKPWRVARTLEELSETDRVAPWLWCVCTKTWSVPSLLPSLRRWLPPSARVLSVQNGMGAEDMLAGTLGPHRVACAAINFAGGIADDGVSTRLSWFNPPNYVGVCSGEDRTAEDAATLLTQAGLPTEAVSSDQIRQRLFYKTVLNVGLNALCAVTGITMGEAMGMPHTRALARTLVEEALAVGQALGHDFGPDAIGQAMRYLDRGGDHKPSMAVDLERKAPTEIDFINGKIVALANDHPDVCVRANQFLASLVVTREVRNGTRRAEDIPAYLRDA
jgi:2-dehydropantoate 2-reductase